MSFGRLKFSAPNGRETINNERHSVRQMSLVLQSLKAYQLKEAHQKASARTARLRISI